MPRFPSELAHRIPVSVTDKLLIHNITTGATEYSTVAEILAAFNISINGDNVGIWNAAASALFEIGSSAKRGNLKVTGSLATDPVVQLYNSKVGGKNWGLYSTLNNGFEIYNITDDHVNPMFTITEAGAIVVGSSAKRGNLKVTGSLATDPVVQLYNSKVGGKNWGLYSTLNNGFEIYNITDDHVNPMFTITEAGVIVVGTAMSIYANNAAAVAGGLAVGSLYRTNADPDPVCVVH